MRGNRQLPPGLADQALELIKTRYADFGPTLAREKLEELHGLFLGKETVRRIMVRAGLWVPVNNVPQGSSTTVPASVYW
jgi:hypothetical protein